MNNIDEEEYKRLIKEKRFINGIISLFNEKEDYDQLFNNIQQFGNNSYYDGAKVAKYNDRVLNLMRKENKGHKK